MSLSLAAGLKAWQEQTPGGGLVWVTGAWGALVAKG